MSAIGVRLVPEDASPAACILTPAGHKKSPSRPWGRNEGHTLAVRQAPHNLCGALLVQTDTDKHAGGIVDGPVALAILPDHHGVSSSGSGTERVPCPSLTLPAFAPALSGLVAVCAVAPFPPLKGSRLASSPLGGAISPEMPSRVVKSAHTLVTPW